MLRAVGTHVLLKLSDKEETTPGGIVLPVTRSEKYTVGEVVSIGEGEEGWKPPCRVGDRILFNGFYNDNVVRIDNVIHVFINFGDVVAIEE